MPFWRVIFKMIYFSNLASNLLKRGSAVLKLLVFKSVFLCSNQTSKNNDSVKNYFHIAIKY